jgi:hypothetical protein
LRETEGLGDRVTVVIGPMVFECPPPQLAEKMTTIRMQEVTTADRQYCIDPPHPHRSGYQELAPEWAENKQCSSFLGVVPRADECFIGSLGEQEVGSQTGLF